MKNTPGPSRRFSPELPEKALLRRRFAPSQAAPTQRLGEPVRTMTDIDIQLRRAPRLGHGLRSLVLQPKLTLGPVSDRYEQEADRVAQEVVARLASPLPTSEEETDAMEVEPMAEGVQRKTLDLAEGGDLDTQLESSIQLARSGGEPLSEHVRGPMESAFAADFGGVKVHTDATADRLNRSLGARAFTTGQDIFFRGGEYQPASSGGQKLLAHELTHVVQQNGKDVSSSNDND